MEDWGSKCGGGDVGVGAVCESFEASFLAKNLAYSSSAADINRHTAARIANTRYREEQGARMAQGQIKKTKAAAPAKPYVRTMMPITNVPPH